MNRVRRGAAWVYRVLITLFVAAVVVEVFLAGLAIFRVMPGEDESVSHETIEDKFDAHAALGDFLGYGSLLLLLVILVAWTGHARSARPSRSPSSPSSKRFSEARGRTRPSPGLSTRSTLF